MSRTAPVTVPFVGEDRVSSVLQGIVTRGVVMGNVITGALNMIGNAATSVFGTMQSQFNNAATVQMGFIGTAGALMGVLNVGFDEALGVAKDLNAEFVALGSRLPGTAADFAMIGSSVSDDIFNAFRKADGTADMPKAREVLLELTEGWGLLANQSMTTVQEASQNLIRLLGGDVNALKMAQFDKSPAFKNALDRVLEADGKTRKDWEASTTAQRAEWLNKAVAMTIPPEAVEAMSRTIEGTVNTWKSRLFDPTSGMIGFLRELSNREGATVMQGLEGIVQSGDKMLNRIIEIWPFKFDVLEPLYDSLVWIRRQIDRATALLSPDDAVAGLQSGTAMLSEAIGKSLQSAALRATVGVGDISRVLSQIDFTQVFSGIVNRVTTAIGSMGFDVGSLDIGSIGKALGGYVINFKKISHTIGRSLFTGLIGIFNSIVTAVANIPFSTSAITGMGIGSIIGEALTRNIMFLVARVIQLIGTANWAGVLRATVNLMAGLTGAVIGLLYGMVRGIIASMPDVTAQIRKVGSSIGGFFGAIAAGAGRMVLWVDGFIKPIWNLAGNIDKSLNNFAANGDQIINDGVARAVEATARFVMAIISLPGRAIDAAVKAGTTIASSLGDLASPIINAIRGIFDGVTQTFSRIKSSLASMMPTMPSMPSIGGITSGISGAAVAATSAVAAIAAPRSSSTAPATGSIASASSAPASSAPSIVSEAAALRTQHNAGGNLAPLFQSLRAEKRAMPSGSNLVIANSSEAILNRRQTRSLASMMVGNRKSSQTAHNGNLTATININGITDPSAVADAVLSRLDAVWGGV